MRIYVINMKNQRERYENIANALKKFDLEWERVDAVNGSTIVREEHPEVFCGTEFIVRHNIFSKAYYRGRLSNGELGCALSHLKIYQKIILSGENGAIVMEDDFVPNTNIVDIIEKALKKKPNADILYCHGKIRAGLRGAIWLHPTKIYGTDRVMLRQGIPGFDWFFNRRRRHQSTVCYWISKSAALKLLELGYPVKFESDVLTGMVAYNKLKFYVIYPELGTLLPVMSSIDSHGGCKFY